MKPAASLAAGNTSNRESISRPKKKTHCQAILEYLQNGGRLTFLDSLRLFNCRALAQRISELRAKGHPIKSKMIATPNGAAIAEYWIESPKEGEQ